MKKWHKVILIFLFFLFFLIAAQIAVSNKNINGLIYDISISIFTSILIFFTISYVLDKANEKENKKKLNAVLNKIKLPVSNFYDFFIDLYIGTNEILLEEDSPLLKNIFINKDEFYDAIIKNINYCELSPYYDGDTFNMKEFFQDKPMQYLEWKKVWIFRYSSIYSDLLFFENNYGIFFFFKIITKYRKFSC